VLQSLRAPSLTLRDEGRQSTAGGLQHRLRIAFAVTEIALSLVLLVSTSLLARSFANLLDADRDLDLARLMVVGLGDPAERQESPAETARASEEIQARVPCRTWRRQRWPNSCRSDVAARASVSGPMIATPPHARRCCCKAASARSSSPRSGWHSKQGGRLQPTKPGLDRVSLS
jgi:hypothetical protein